MNILLLPKACPATYELHDAWSSKHLTQVLKAQVGDKIKVGIRQGNLGHATIEQIGHLRVTLKDIECRLPPPQKLPLTVVLALPRPKVLRRLILDMTAMGVQNLYLVNSYRSEKSYWQTPFLNKLDDYVTEGLQQACDTIPLNIYLKKRLKPFIEDELPEIIANQQALIAHPYANGHFSQVFKQGEETVLVIGAEGGWIDYEVELFKKVGCIPVTIGERILRTENAVSVLCGQVLLNS